MSTRPPTAKTPLRASLRLRGGSAGAQLLVVPQHVVGSPAVARRQHCRNHPCAIRTRARPTPQPLPGGRPSLPCRPPSVCAKAAPAPLQALQLFVLCAAVDAGPTHPCATSEAATPLEQHAACPSLCPALRLRRLCRPPPDRGRGRVEAAGAAGDASAPPTAPSPDRRVCTAGSAGAAAQHVRLLQGRPRAADLTSPLPLFL